MTTQKRKPVAQALATFVKAEVALFTTLGAQCAANAEANGSRSKAHVANIGTLYVAIGDGEAYLSCIAEAYGNGERGKLVAEGGKRTVGKIAEALKAAGITHLTVKGEMHHCRKLALNWHNADVRKAAEEGGMTAGYRAVKAATPATAAATPAAAATAKPVTLSELIGVSVKTDPTGSEVLAILESALSAAAHAIEASKVREVRLAIASK